LKAFFEKIKNNDFYKMWFKDALPYVTGAVLLSVFQIVTFSTTGNIGALFSGIASLSLSGWVFAAFMFAGAIIGSKLLVKYFM
jgi:hypothetical protein